MGVGTNPPLADMRESWFVFSEATESSFWLKMKNRKVTIQDIADQASVSKATVSRVLNNHLTVNAEKREAVLAAMEALNYEPSQLARSLAGGRSMTVGILTQNIGTAFYDQIVRGVIASLAGTGYSPIFADGQFDRELAAKAVETLLGRNVDGVVLVGGNLPLQHLESLKGKVPTIVVARQLENWGDQCIYMDNFEAGYLATQFLIDQGHRAIAHIKGNVEHEDAIRRYRGYRKAMEDAKIPIDEELIYEGNFHGQCGTLAIESFLMRGKNFTAVFAANDLSAFGARLALYRRGIRVPDEVSLIGVDDMLEAALMPPPLTTIRQPAAEMGRAAGKSILSLIQGQLIPAPRLIPELIRRESVSTLH